MAQVGRISGPLLQADLLRNGIDLAFETDLVYLDVSAGRVGIRTNSPTNELQSPNEIRTTNLIVDTQADINDIINIQGSSIQPFPGSLFLDARHTITANRVKTDNLLLDDDRISTYTTDTNIELRPNGTGRTEFKNLWVENNFNITGDVRLDGNITFGNQDTDSVTFDADITSDIIPDADITYNLGTAAKRWQTIESRLLNGQDIDAQVALIGGVDIGTRQGNIWYVSTNGDNANVGDHQQGPFRTIDYAVTQASAGDTIYVFPGEYEETCPITIPTGVSIVGTDMRNTVIRPVSSDNFVDIFLLNDQTYVSHLTIKDFYYDSINNVGHAFRFANGTTITTRPPYIENVSVITRGSVTSASDPLGFEQGDAGKGALVDGADVLSTTTEASMLFYSTTFITPGVDALTMTNGVRVEWLDSFTYFANRGFYAVDGATGLLSPDGSTIKYGAAIRSINSANVYGNYGAVADGVDTLMYLIMHNMAYIGSGKFSDNDTSRVIQANEAVKLNSGKIYYQTVNHLGDFRIGENFFINAETGESSIVITEGEVQGFGRLRVTNTDTGNITIVDGEEISTGNLLFTGNEISSVLGDVNFASAGVINLLDNVNITGDLAISGDLTFDGSLNLLGNQTTDTLTFNVNIEQDLNPNTTLSFDLGSPSKTWNNVWLSEAQIGDLQIQDNYITTDISNADLELRANGIGEILIPSNNVQIDNDLTVSTNTDLQSTTITGLLDQTGDRTQTGNFTLNGEWTVDNVYLEDNFISTTTGNLNLQATGNINVDTNNVELAQDLTVSGSTNLQSLSITGLLNQTGDRNQTGDYSVTNLTLTGDLTVGSQVQLEEILFDGNVITTTTTNADLDLRASGTGEILVPNDNVQVNNNFEVQGTTFTRDINNSVTVEAVTLTTGDVNITSNVIDTSTSNSNLELRANGTGLLYVPTDDVQIDNNLTVSGTTTSGDLGGINKLSLLHTLDNPNPVGPASGDKFSGSFNTTTRISENYAIVGAPYENDDLNTSQGKAYIFDISTGSLLHTLNNPTTGDTTAEFGRAVSIVGNYAIVGDPSRDTTSTNSGKVYVYDVTTGNLLFEIDNPNEAFSARFGTAVASNGSVIAVGTSTPANLVYLFDMSGNLLETLSNPNINPISSSDSFGSPISISDNYLIVSAFGEQSPADDIGSGAAYIYDLNTRTLVHSIINPNAYGTPVSDYFGNDVDITDTHAIVSARREDDAGGTTSGKAYIFDVASGSLLHTLDNPNAYGTSADDNFGQSVAINGNYAIVGAYLEDDVGSSASGKAYVFDVTTGNLITTVENPNTGNKSQDYFGSVVDITNKHFIVAAHGTEDPAFESGKAYVYDISAPDTIVDVNVTGTITHVGDTTQTGNYTQTGNLVVDGEVTFDRRVDFEDVSIDGNVITTDLSNSDLELRASGTGVIRIANSTVFSNNMSAANIVVGDINIDNDLVLDELAIRDSNISINDNYIETSVTNSNLELLADDGIISIPTNNTTIEQNLTVNGVTDIDDLNIQGNVVQTGAVTQTGDVDITGDITIDGKFTIADQPFQFEDINVDGNVLTTTLSNSSLDLRANGTGLILVPFADVNVTGNLTARNITTDNIVINDSFALENMTSSTDIEMFDNVITTTNSNSNLELRANGTGTVRLQEIAIENNVMFTDTTTVVLDATNVIIDAVGSLQLPIGNNTDVLNNSVTGDIRFNTTYNLFEGFSQTNQFFGGVFSQDASDNIQAINNNIVFRVNNALVANVDANTFFVTGLDVNDITIRNNTVRSTVDNDLLLTPNGTGNIVIDELNIDDNKFINSTTAGLTIASTRFGYSKIPGTHGYVVPLGDESNKGATPQQGEIRWNTALGIEEVYNGTQWIAARGIVDNVTAAQMGELVDEWSLILG